VDAADLYLISFFTELPFDVPVPQESTITVAVDGVEMPELKGVPVSVKAGVPPFLWDGWPFVSFCFWRVVSRLPSDTPHLREVLDRVLPKQLPPATPQSANLPTPPRSFLTVVKMTTVRRLSGEFEQGEVSDAFDACLEVLNRFLLAYTAVTKDLTVRPVGLRSLPPLAICTLRNLGEPPPPSRVGASLLNPRAVPYEKELVAEEKFSHIMGLLSAAQRGLQPFFLFSELHAQAARELLDGRYGSAIVTMETAVEVFCDELLRLLMEREGAAQTEIDEMFQPGTSFRSRVRSQFHCRLGGYFDLTDSSRPVGKWFARLFLLRNDVVHRGARPTSQQSEAALTAADELFKYMISLLRSKAPAYDHILLYLS
jgi:hypothetical protein